MSFPEGRGSLTMGELGQIEIDLPNRWSIHPSQGVIEAERIDVAPDRLFHVSDRLVLSLAFAVRGDVRDASGESALLWIRNEFNGERHFWSFHDSFNYTTELTLQKEEAIAAKIGVSGLVNLPLRAFR